MSFTQADPVADRRTQILDAAVLCFARKGFHLTSMHDISAEAGISVGLIYRYFQNKEAVIAAMADGHKTEIGELLERARLAPTLLEALEIIVSDLGQIEKRLERLQKDLKKMRTLALERENELLLRAKLHVEQERPLRELEMTADERRLRQLEVTRRLWQLLFNKENEPAYA